MWSPCSVLKDLRLRDLLPSGARRTRDEQARSQTECQSDRHHDKGAGERRFGGHQEDDAQQQDGYSLQRCPENRVMDALLKSVSFNVGAAGATGTAMGAAARAEIDALEKQKQELLQKVAAIEARQRQLAGTGAAAPSATATPTRASSP